MTTLMDFQYQSIFKAENGENGRPKSQHGKGGKDLYIKVPLGTVVKDPENDKIIADLTEPEQKVLVAKGGRGGRGKRSLRGFGGCLLHQFYSGNQILV